MPIVILLRGDGTIALNNVAASLTELSDLLVSEIEAGAPPELMVRADALANTKDVVAVLRQAKIAGIEAVALATQPNTFR